MNYCLIIKNLQKTFFQKQTQMSIVEKCKEPLNPFSHNSYRLFNAHNMQGTTHSQTPELRHQQIL